MSGAITIQNDEEQGVYRLVGPNSEEGPITDWGTPATLSLGDYLYMAFIDFEGLPCPEIGTSAYQLSTVLTEAEDVEFDIPEEEEPGETGVVEKEIEEPEEEEGEEPEEPEEDTEGAGDDSEEEPPVDAV
jgi:hypothetical protein